MPLPRVFLLLRLCGLLLAVVAVTAAHAAAPASGSELTITVQPATTTKTRAAQAQACQTIGGALLPMVTETVYEATLSQMRTANQDNAFGYMGGSTLLSGAVCPTDKKSLSCIWYWDQGRYNSTDTAVPFFKGNRYGNDLKDAGMLTTEVGDHWGVQTGSLKFPGSAMQRYGMALRVSVGDLTWADSSDTEWSYSYWIKAPQSFVFCASETSMPGPPKPTNPDAGKSTSLSVGVIVGISAGAAALVVVVVVFILCLPCCCGCCCFAASPAVAPTASQGGGLSRTNSCRSCRSGFGDVGNRSFHDGAASKDGYSRRSSFHGGVAEAGAEAWQGGEYEMVSVSGSHYGRIASGANGSWAPPPRASSQMMMPVPPQMMMPVPPHMMAQPQRPMSMHGNWLA